MATFADLDIRFHLSQGPDHRGVRLRRPATCRLCGVRERQCFELAIGDVLILPSPTCGWATVSVQTTGLPTLSVLRLDRPVPRQPQDRDATARLLRRGRCLGFRCISPAI